MQVIEIIGISPNRVCGRARSNKLMDPQLTNYFPFETEGAESEDGDISMDWQLTNHFLPETEGVEYEDRDVGYDDKEEYQSPLAHNDTSMSCMSWLVGPTTKLFKLFCFCCPPRDFS